MASERGSFGGRAPARAASAARFCAPASAAAALLPASIDGARDDRDVDDVLSIPVGLLLNVGAQLLQTLNVLRGIRAEVDGHHSFGILAIARRIRAELKIVHHHAEDDGVDCRFHLQRVESAEVLVCLNAPPLHTARTEYGAFCCVPASSLQPSSPKTATATSSVSSKPSFEA